MRKSVLCNTRGKGRHERILQPTSLPLARLGPLALYFALREILIPSQQQYSRIMREIMDVPFPLAASRRLISFFTFQISMFFSASLAWASLILAVFDASSRGVLSGLHDRWMLDSAVHRCQDRSFLGGGCVTWDCGQRASRR